MPPDWPGPSVLLNDGSSVTPLSRARDLCAECVDITAVSGVALSIAGGGVHSTVCGSDRVVTRLEEVQFGLGEGPVADALAYGLPVLAPDLADVADQRWPWFAPAAVRAGARAVFVVPLRCGPLRPGALSLYRYTPGSLTTKQLKDARVLAAVATTILTCSEEDPAKEPGSWACGEGSGFQPEVHQAVGATMVQLSVGAGTALDRMRAHAYAHDEPIGDIAHDIMTGHLKLDPDAA